MYFAARCTKLPPFLSLPPSLPVCGRNCRAVFPKATFFSFYLEWLTRVYIYGTLEKRRPTIGGEPSVVLVLVAPPPPFAPSPGALPTHTYTRIMNSPFPPYYPYPPSLSFSPPPGAAAHFSLPRVSPRPPVPLEGPDTSIPGLVSHTDYRQGSLLLCVNLTIHKKILIKKSKKKSRC